MNSNNIIKLLITGYAFLIVAFAGYFSYRQDVIDNAQWNKLNKIEQLVLKYHLKKVD